jgi:hypothetical protein
MQWIIALPVRQTAEVPCDCGIPLLAPPVKGLTHDDYDNPVVLVADCDM